MAAKKNNGAVRYLGKILFPGQARWQQRTGVLTMFWSIAAGLVVGGIVVAFMLLHGSR